MIKKSLSQADELTSNMVSAMSATYTICFLFVLCNSPGTISNFFFNLH